MTRDNLSNNDNAALIKRLDALISIMINQPNFAEYNQAQKIDYLSTLNFSNPEMATLLNTTLKTIEARKYGKRKKVETK